jgi:hypothetical protein
VGGGCQAGSQKLLSKKELDVSSPDDGAIIAPAHQICDLIPSSYISSHAQSTRMYCEAVSRRKVDSRCDYEGTKWGANAPQSHS